MRLLALDDCDLVTGHLSLCTFSGTDIPAYAILSHRWTDDEVLFTDVEDKTSIDRVGYFKLRGAISQARADGFAYLWDDTCCIDKSSSAELSEAINSMWVWYRDAAICYAYLCDVSSSAEVMDFEAQFGSSGWFTRGWTLQELIAPKHVEFYNESRTSIGSRQTLCQMISNTTGIDADYLNHARHLSAASIAKRMSWASHRKTTRLEDIAYCLMGIFSVNMPMLYGEGSRAFQRLQEEILRSSDDESIFAWVDKEAEPNDLHGLLADSPLQFHDSGNIGPLLDPNSERKPLQLTNLGLNIQRRLIGGQMPLLCGYRDQAGYLSVATTHVGGQHARYRLAELRGCMHVEHTGNLSFPQLIPRFDRFHDAHANVIRYAVAVSSKTTQDGVYVQHRHKASMHPMCKHLDPDLYVTRANPAKVYEVPKFGTYMDFIVQFQRPADNAWIFVIIGVENAKELAFAAGAGDDTYVNRHFNRGNSVEATSQSMFAKLALPIGLDFIVENLHRVSVRRLPTESAPSVVDGNQIVRLEIDIEALKTLQVEQQLPNKPSCCSVQ